MAWQLCGTKIELDLRHVTHCHTHTAATLTNTLCFTHTLSLARSYTQKNTLSNLISANCFGAAEGRRQARFVSPFGIAAQQFSPRCHFIHFYSLLFRIYQHFFRHPPSTPPLPARLCMSHSLLLCLHLEMRFENLQKNK